MTKVQALANFVKNSQYQNLSDGAINELKLRLLDSLACSIAALHYELSYHIKEFIVENCPSGPARMIGGGRSSLSLAGLNNSFLVRYLDFNDSYLAEKETFHPSDIIGGLLACGDYMQSSGKEFLLSLALSYTIQSQLSELAPVRDKGFDHTVHLAYAASAAISNLLNLSEDKIANAIAISGCSNNALRVTRTGRISHWKGIAAAYTVMNASYAALMARHGICGPEEIFEGNKGFEESIAGNFEVDWKSVSLDAVKKSIIKKYNAEIHAQTSIESALELKHKHSLSVKDIETIRVDTFDVAFNIIGGGEEGTKQIIQYKEEADHSLAYMLAVALIDGKLLPQQYFEERIKRSDVQLLMKKIKIRSLKEFSEVFPNEMPSRVMIILKNRKEFALTKRDYEGFHTHPMNWNSVGNKFVNLTHHLLQKEVQAEIIEFIKDFERRSVSQLMDLLNRIS